MFLFPLTPTARVSLRLSKFLHFCLKIPFSERLHWGGENNYEIHEKRRNSKLPFRSRSCKIYRFIPPEFKAVIREIWCAYVSGFLSFQPLHPPESSDFLGLTGPFQPRATISCKKPNFGGFLINLSCQTLGDKMVKIREGGAAVEG